MKMIGHVATALLAASPLIHARHWLPVVPCAHLSDAQLLWWAGVWSAVPDLDILLSRWTPMKHRGFTSHSLYTAVFCGLAVLFGWVALVAFPADAVASSWVGVRAARVAPFLYPGTALLACLSVTVHLLGDSLTKTGVPLFQPERMWHFPVIGGHASFDNYWLNMIPVVAAGYVLHAWFGLGARSLWSFARWSIPQ